MESWDPAVVGNLIVIVVAVIAVAFAIVLATTVLGGRRTGRTASARVAGLLREALRAAPPPARDVRVTAATDGLESYRWALVVREEAFGPNHPDVATACHILGVMYAEQEKFAEAEPLLQRALHIRTGALGPTHSEVALTIEDLAGLYLAQGRHVEAEALLEGLRAIQPTAQPAAPATRAESNSPVARSGSVATADGGRDAPTGPDEWSDGEPERPKVPPTSGPAVPGTAAEVTPVGGALVGLRAAEAEPPSTEELYRRELAMMEATGATDRPELRTVLHELGRLYYRQGAYAEAEPLLERALVLAQRALGADAPEVAAIRDDLAWLRFSRRSLPGA